MQDNSITEQLVDRVAKAVYTDQMSRMPEVVQKQSPEWDGLSGGTKHTIRENILGLLNLVVPEMLAEGWQPPAEPASLSEWLNRKAEGGAA